MKMTEADFRSAVRDAVKAYGMGEPIGRTIDNLEALAVDAGAEFTPEQVEPVVGEPLTEATRLVPRMLVRALNGMVGLLGDTSRSDKYNFGGCWWLTGQDDPVPVEHCYGWEIALVPGVEPETEQKHETTTSQEPGSNGPRWRWKCLCGEVSILCSVREDAESDARWHIRAQS